MNIHTETKTLPLKRVCDRLEIGFSELHRAVEKKMGSTLPASTFQYYFKDARNKDGTIPAKKNWRDALREVLMARGMTAAEAAELFGIYQDQEIVELRRTIELLERTVGTIAQSVLSLQNEIADLKKQLN